MHLCCVPKGFPSQVHSDCFARVPFRAYYLCNTYDPLGPSLPISPAQNSIWLLPLVTGLPGGAYFSTFWCALSMYSFCAGRLHRSCMVNLHKAVPAAAPTRSICLRTATEGRTPVCSCILRTLFAGQSLARLLGVCLDWLGVSVGAWPPAGSPGS